MAASGLDASMQEPVFNIGIASFIDIHAVLLQSDPAGGWDRTLGAAIFVLAAAAGWAIWRRRLAACPGEPVGRIPQDALLGVIAMLGFMLVGSLGAAAWHAPAITDADYARLAQGAAGNVTQLALALLVIRSALFIDGPRSPMRPRIAATEGAAGFLLVVPIVFALGSAIGILLEQLGHPPAPQTSHETLRILAEKGDRLFTALTLAHVALLVPLAEEAGWRGLLQPSLRRAGLGGVPAALATATIFAAIHWPMIPPEGRVAGLSMLVALGFAMGVLRERTGGILAPTVLHAAFNALNVAITLAPGR